MIYNQSMKDLTENVIRTYKLMQMRCLGNSHKISRFDSPETYIRQLCIYNY